MKTLISTYLPTNGFDNVTIHSIGPTPSVQDRFTIADKYGSTIQMEVGVLNTVVEALAKSRNMTVADYLEAVKRSVMQ